MADHDMHATEGDPNDYSCYITVVNKSDSDLLLSDFGIVDGWGQWPLYQPLNTIEAQSSGRVQLQDPKVRGGSEGWLVYEVKVKDRTEQFKLEFSDPQTFLSKNYLRCPWTSDGNRLRVNVGPYDSSGHPFYGQVEVYTNPSAVAEANPKAMPVTVKTSDEVHANFEIGFDYPGPGEKYPVHESIAIAAFLRSSVIFPKATTYNNLNNKQWEYFRGILWNDDPRCLLFKNDENDNRSFGLGGEWWTDFQFGNDRGMTRRSHFGDLQFLHAMGAREGEKAQDTRTRMLEWMGVMYKLACSNQGVSENDKIGKHLSQHFSNGSNPALDNTLRDLILSSTAAYRRTRTDLRALGICMHMIQDSYALGHVQRRLRNPQDFEGRDDDGFFRFRPGTFGQWGAILAFHTYGGQDDDRHSHYDGLEGADLPNPRDINSFNRLAGSRDAIEACTAFINAFAERKPWKEVREFLESKVFELDPNARDCNTAVDDWPTSLAVVQVPTQQNEEFDYDAGLQQKLSILEAGFSKELQQARCFRGRDWRWQGLLSSIVLIILALGMFVGRLL